jgi:hypothetical protein
VTILAVEFHQPVLERGRHRLFDEDVLASLQGGDAVLGVR